MSLAKPHWVAPINPPKVFSIPQPSHLSSVKCELWFNTCTGWLFVVDSISPNPHPISKGGSKEFYDSVHINAIKNIMGV